MANKDQGGMPRRDFLLTAAAGAAALSLGGLGLAKSAQASHIKKPPLPYAENALEPYISARTIKYHYGKHHLGYVKKTNKAIKGTPYEKMDLVQIIRATAGKRDEAHIFNNAAQVWNHTFYWLSMRPGGGGKPMGELAGRINQDFGSYQNFAQALLKTSKGRFGSGWGWLVLMDGKLRVISTPNAETPIAYNVKPLLTLDVWEHAYYLDYQNRRGDYLKNIIKHLINWEFANKNLLE